MKWNKASFRFRRGLQQDLPTLDVGEPGFTTDTHKLYVGTSNGNIQLGASEAPEIPEGTKSVFLSVLPGATFYDKVVYAMENDFRVVHLEPYGKYTLDRRLDLENITIEGHQAELLLTNPVYTPELYASDSVSHIQCNANVTIKNLRLTQGKSVFGDRMDIPCIVLMSATNIRLEGCTISEALMGIAIDDVPWYAVPLGADGVLPNTQDLVALMADAVPCKNIVITNCVFENLGVGIFGYGTVEGAIIEACVIREVEDVFLFISQTSLLFPEKMSKNISIRNNRVMSREFSYEDIITEDGEPNVPSFLTAFYITDITLDNNYVEKFWVFFEGVNTLNVTMTNNFFYRVGQLVVEQRELPLEKYIFQGNLFVEHMAHEINDVLSGGSSDAYSLRPSARDMAEPGHSFTIHVLDNMCIDHNILNFAYDTQATSTLSPITVVANNHVYLTDYPYDEMKPTFGRNTTAKNNWFYILEDARFGIKLGSGSTFVDNMITYAVPFWDPDFYYKYRYGTWDEAMYRADYEENAYEISKAIEIMDWDCKVLRNTIYGNQSVEYGIAHTTEYKGENPDFIAYDNRVEGAYIEGIIAFRVGGNTN